jgi:nicotinate-nucleotide pyrophosphorylase (carboxylating)
MTDLLLGSVHRKHAEALAAGGLDVTEVERVVRRALEEDLAFGPDVTTDSTVSPREQATGDLVPR